MTEKEALAYYVIKMADDQFIYGHRNSEWIGLGPLLEEDITFASIAQDKVGQSRVLYQYLHTQGLASTPDQFAFLRPVEEWLCCHFVEFSARDYELALVRHFLFDEAELVRFQFLVGNSNADLSAYARKFAGEIKYHTLHGRSMIKRLITSEEGRDRIINSLDFLIPLAYGMFEPMEATETGANAGLFPREAVLAERWKDAVSGFLRPFGYTMSDAVHESGYGGRRGVHTAELLQVLSEVSEVIGLDPQGEW